MEEVQAEEGEGGRQGQVGRWPQEGMVGVGWEVERVRERGQAEGASVGESKQVEGES